MGVTLYRRTTLVVEAGTVVHRFMDIADPSGHPAEVLNWLARTSS